MDHFRSPYQPNLPPVQLNVNDPPIQEASTFTWPDGFVFNASALQQAQVAQNALTSFFRSQMQTNQPPIHHPLSSTQPISPTPPNTMFYHQNLPSSSVTHNTINVPTQPESNTTEASNVPPKVTNRERKNWKRKEDISLCEAWVERSENSIHGNNQTFDGFWSHIFDEFRKTQPGTVRTKKALENRWTSISREVTKWRGVVRSVQRNHVSGTNVADEWGACYEEFKNKHGNDFKFKHCWDILQHSPKWSISDDERIIEPSSPKNYHVNGTPPTNLCDDGLDNVNDTGVYPVLGLNVDAESPLPSTPTEPNVSCVRSQPRKRGRPLGRDTAKAKKLSAETQAGNDVEVRKNIVGDELSKLRTSQDNQFQIMLETKKAQFECMKAANEVQAFELMKQAKLDQLQSYIGIVKSLEEAEEKMLIRSPDFLTPEVAANNQAVRFMKLQNYAQQHDEIEKLRYSPGGSANVRLNNIGLNMEPRNLETRYNMSSDFNEQD